MDDLPRDRQDLSTSTSRQVLDLCRNAVTQIVHRGSRRCKRSLGASVLAGTRLVEDRLRRSGAREALDALVARPLAPV